jgi:hypothetical protein
MKPRNGLGLGFSYETCIDFVVTPVIAKCYCHRTRGHD